MEELINKLDQKILDIELEYLKGTIMGFSKKDLKNFRLKTIGDLLEYNLVSYYLKGNLNSYQKSISYYFYEYGKSNKERELRLAKHFQTTLRNRILTKIKFVEDHRGTLFNNDSHNMPLEKILRITFDDLRELLLTATVNKLKSFHINTIKQLFEFDLKKIVFSDNVGFSFIQRIMEFKEKAITQPESIIDFLHKYDLSPEEKAFNKIDLLNRIPEIIIDKNENNLSKQEFLETRLITSISIIPEFVLTKLLYNNVKTIKDLLKSEISQFSMHFQNNKKFCKEYAVLRNDMIKNPGKYCNNATPAQKKVLGMREFLAIRDKNDIMEENLRWFSINDPLPLLPGIPETETPLGIFKTIIKDYHQESKIDQDTPDVLAMYYGIEEEKKNFDQIAFIFKSSPHNYRRLYKKKLAAIGSLLNGQKIGSKFIFIRREAQILLTEPVRYITEKPFHIYDEIKNYFVTRLLETFDEEKENLLELFLHAMNYRIIKPTKTSSFKETIVIKRNKHGMEFNAIKGELYAYIKSVPGEISQDEILNNFCKKKKIANSDLIISILSLLPMIEAYEVSGKLWYRKKLTLKSRNKNILYNILAERGEKMHRDEIINELKLRLGKSKKNLNNYLTQLLSHDKQFNHVGRTNYWILGEWNVNTDSQKELIRKALLTIKKPATTTEIVNEIHKIRPEVKHRSISTVLTTNYIPIKESTYILPEWKHRYPDLIIKPKKEISDPGDWPSAIAIREKIVDLLKRSENRKLRSSEIGKIIRSENPALVIQKICKILSSKKYFKRSYDSNNKLIIELK